MSLEHDSNKINWNTLVFVTLFHIVAVAAFFTFSWSNFFAFLFLWWFAGSLGVGIDITVCLRTGFKLEMLDTRSVDRYLAYIGRNLG